jgi:hypothetical protein
MVQLQDPWDAPLVVVYWDGQVVHFCCYVWLIGSTCILFACIWNVFTYWLLLALNCGDVLLLYGMEHHPGND